MSIKRIICLPWCWFESILAWLAPIGDLVVRVYVAYIFFLSGLTKVSAWQSTVYLFEYEYSVPLFTAYWAALLATGVELIIPILLILGLLGRFPAFVLFIFNLVAAWTYPFLWTEMGAEGLEDHVYWSLLLLLLMLHGSGKISLDTLLKRWFGGCKTDVKNTS